MHSKFDPIRVSAPSTTVTTRFALMTDLTRFWPEAQDHPHSRLPGILMTLDTKHPIPTSADKQTTLLFAGSSEIPTAVSVLSVGGHLFMQLANPLDPALRSAMRKQHDAERLPQLVVAKDGLLRPNPPPLRFWRTALTYTEGKAEVNALDWLASAYDLVEALPSLMAEAVPLFGACKWYHAYFVVPDDRSHPLYSRVT